MKLYLIFLNVWIASVYYMIYCEPRSYNNALAGFWGIMAIFWIYDLKVNYTPFDRTHKHTALAVLLCMLPLAYPLFSIIRGDELSHDDLTCNALFGSGFHHRTAAGIFQTSQYLSRHVSLPLGTDRFHQNLLFPYS